MVVATNEKLFVGHGIVRRRAAAVRLARVGTPFGKATTTR